MLDVLAELSLALISSTVFLHTINEPSRKSTQKFLRLSYSSPSSDGTYTQGIDDIYFVLAWVVNFTALRAISIEWILTPLGRYLGVEKKNHLRFAEQGWLVLYYGVFWTLGMHLWINSEYWLANKQIWASWPQREMSGTFKWYYLVQLAFWFQQILVIHIEKRRKDHTQMLTHHIITCSLISVTYIAKIMKYLRRETACNAAFGLFVVTWFISRHVMYIKLCWDIYSDVPNPETFRFGCYAGPEYKDVLDISPYANGRLEYLTWPFKDAGGIICGTTEVKWVFLGMLLALQGLCLIWFGMIVKVIVGILMGKGAEDTRSDDEDEIEDEEIEAKGPRQKSTQGKAITIDDLNICVSGGTESWDIKPSSTSLPRITRTRGIL
ncbi:Sphingosine N-acyltransferase lag1 [Clarireedia jacksonii]